MCMTPQQMCLAAADHIARVGWTTEPLHANDDVVCGCDENLQRHVPALVEEEFRALAPCSAMGAFYALSVYEPGVAAPDTVVNRAICLTTLLAPEGIGAYNEAPGRTKEEVIALLRQAALL